MPECDTLQSTVIRYFSESKLTYQLQ